ncbi:MAG: GNAT family N-acetyltransferase [Anaerolineaceae bacterium]|nr:GNAT family N-acetyltransferase [Anaerolineaceae bacterium]
MSDILTDFSTPAILNAIQANAYAFFVRREKILGKTITKDSGLTWLESPSSAPVAWLHGLITTDEAPARTAQVTSCFAAHGFSEVYLVAFEVGQCRAAWQAAGASQIETEHVMVIILSGADKTRPAIRSLSIESVTDDLALQDCAAVISAGRDQWSAGFFQLTNPSIAAGQESMRYYLARLGGRPVATAAQFFWAGLAGIWWVTTTPELQRRGVATAITRAALADASRLGYRAAMLESLPHAVPMYRRLGFREYCRINVYRWRSPIDRPS